MARPRVLFAWEMGGNFGHVAKIAPVARAVCEFADVTVALRESAALRQVAPDLPVQVLPAPFARTGQQSCYTYSGMLLTEGWGDVTVLGSLIETWRTIFALTKPDVLVAQAAPTALLAACGLPMRRIILGSGYDNPPFATPMPLFDPDNTEVSGEAAEHERRALENANAALAMHGGPELGSFRETQQSDASLLVAWPETDHYGDRSAIQPDAPEYLGQIMGLSSGAKRKWTKRKGPKIFAYLRVATAAGAAGLGALHAIAPDADVICAAPGISPVDAKKLTDRGMQIVDGPVQLDPLLPACDLCLTHGSSGVASTALAAGIRQITLPTHREQALFSRTLARQKLAVSIEGQYEAKTVFDVLKKVTENQSLKHHVQSVAAGIKNRFAQPAESLAADVIRKITPG